MRRAIPYVFLVAFLPVNAGAEVRLEVGTVDGRPGAVVSLTVRLRADLADEIAGIAHEISVDPDVVRPHLLADGKPDCAVDSQLPVFLSGFVGQPSPCPSGGACSGVKAALLFSDVFHPAPAGSVLYRCRFQIAFDAPPGVYPVTHVDASYTTVLGAELPATGVGGAVVVAGDPLPTETPRTPLPTPRVLGPDCTGDCNGSDSVDAAEEDAVLQAIFDPRTLAECVGSEGASEPRAKAAHLLAATRARLEGCSAGAPTATRSRTRTATATLRPTTTATATASRRPTRTSTASGTRTPTHTVTPTSSATRSRTPTASASGTRTPTHAVTPTSTSTRSRTPTISASVTRTPTHAVTPTSTSTRSPTPTTSASGTRTPAHTVTPTSSSTRSPTPTASASLTRTPTHTVTSTSTSTRSQTPTASASVTRTPTYTVTSTSTSTRSQTPTASASVTRTPTHTVTSTSTSTASATSTISPTATRTTAVAPTGTETPTLTRSVTGTRTPIPTETRTDPPTPTYTGTPIPTSAPGPVVTSFAIANADGTLSQPVDMSPDGVPIYQRPLGFGFVIVVEGMPGDDNLTVGSSSFDHDPSNPERRPDLQLLSDSPLGNGSTKVCGNSPPNFGGVAAVPALNFDVTQPISDAINDIGCRFVDGKGKPRGRLANSACILYPSGEYHFADSRSEIQFCATVTRLMEFPAGDTRLRVRLRNVGGHTGGIREIIVRSQS